MQLGIRKADITDERAIQAVDGLARRGDSERINFIHEAVAGGRCVVAESGMVIGYVVSNAGRFFARDFVELLMVHDESRRRGVGRVLLRAAVDHAVTSRVFSSTNESNTAMRSLFVSEGWTLSGQLTGLDDGDPEVVYFIDQ